MFTRFISLPCIVMVFAAIMQVSQAKATILTTLAGATEATVTKSVFDAEVFERDCGIFSYLQRMVINGQPVQVITEYIYDIGKYELTYLGECDGYAQYGVGTCACLTADA